MLKNNLRNLFRVEHNAENRIFGLDLLRFVAIVMVVLGHGCIVLPEPVKRSIQRFMLDGVGIFFVLSGFLIGGILLRQLEKGKHGWADLMHFWKRRWMRTLPAYLFVLLVIIAYTLLVMPDKMPERWYEFFFFMQNLFHPRPSFFGESWSLSVEEWFYLLIPVLIFGGIALFRSRPKVVVLIVIFLVMAAVMLHRYFIYQSMLINPGTADFDAFRLKGDELITYRVFPRLDALMFGVLGAYLMHYFPKIWNFRYKFLLFIGCGIILYFFKRDNTLHFELLDAVWMPAIKSVAVLLALPFLSTLVIRPNWFTRFVTFISLISYSMYLVNLKIVLFMIMKNGIYQQYTGRWQLHSWWGWDYALFWTLVIVLSYLMYKLIEVPFMKLRKADK